jgi:O-antigen ligase
VSTAAAPAQRWERPRDDLPLLPAAVTGFALALGVALALAAVQRPLAVLAGTAGLAVVTFCLLRVDAAVLLLVASAPLEEALPLAGSGLSLTKLLGALCFASFALHALRTRRPLVLDGTQAIVLGILALALLSMVAAAEPGAASTTAARYASFALLYVVITQLAGDEAFLVRVAWTLSLASTAAAMWGLSNYFSGVTPVATFPAANAGDFSFMLATTLPFTFWLLGRTRALRLVVLLAITLMFAAIVLSLSRGAVVGLAVGFLFVLLIDRRATRYVVAGGLVALAAAALVIRSDPARFENALFLKERVADYNVTTRYDAWRAAAQLIADRPLLGVGPGNFQFHYLSESGRPPGSFSLAVAHNAYLDVGAELGVAAMLLFLLYLGISLHRALVLTRTRAGPPGYAQALAVSLVVACACAFFLSEQYFLPFWLVGGLITGIWRSRDA